MTLAALVLVAVTDDVACEDDSLLVELDAVCAPLSVCRLLAPVDDVPVWLWAPREAVAASTVKVMLPPRVTGPPEPEVNWLAPVVPEIDAELADIAVAEWVDDARLVSEDDTTVEAPVDEPVP